MAKTNTPRDEADKLLQEMRLARAVGMPLSYNFVIMRLTEIKNMHDSNGSLEHVPD